ncbi:MAG: peptidylprolyl isomerase [Bacteroidetes bacterium]|nr:peptidylprolyl isomerase [Bacteroidota bacterium]MBS1972791.1 peptidylprolyl isomerase [Bacteroidota bacterium]
MKTLNVKFVVAVVFFQLMLTNGKPQAVFSYGANTVSKEDFLKAYTKNNNEGKPTEKSYRDYLELYIRYKLKVKAAYDMHLDSLSAQLTELKNFRNQVANGYMNDEESLNKLINEAYERSLKDVHVAFIFVAAPQNATPADTLGAYKKINSIYNELKKEKDFGEEAALHSEDPSAKNNHGDLGWINVFTLPYELETLAYATQPLHFSKPYRAKGGYVIFKNLGERKASGKIKVAHILLAIPPNADTAVKAQIKLQADSVYNAIINGANFGELARKYSSDNLSYQTGGEIAEFGVGKYEPAFEEAAFHLNKDGEVGKPVLTTFGYHIIKLLSKRNIPEKDKETFEGLKQRIKADARIAVATKKFLNKIFRQTNFKKYPVNEQKLSIYTDSILQRRSTADFPQFSNNTLLFSINKKNYTIKDWINYARGAKSNPVFARKNNGELMEKFIEMTALTYYREHLEEYNKDFAYQLKEFREGNLLFEVMQRKIWDKAAVDSAGLRNYYNAHRDKYWWQPGADAVLFTCTSEKAADDVKSKLQNNFPGWRKLIDGSNGSVQADSGRFEQAQLPISDKKSVTAGFTSFIVVPPDNTVSFAYIIRLYSEKTSRSFEEAKGFVINDYQNYLEDKWIAELKKKYPVKVNETVLKSLLK